MMSGISGRLCIESCLVSYKHQAQVKLQEAKVGRSPTLQVLFFLNLGVLLKSEDIETDEKACHYRTQVLFLIHYQYNVWDQQQCKGRFQQVIKRNPPLQLLHIDMYYIEASQAVLFCAVASPSIVELIATIGNQEKLTII